ncbi:MAG: hypothetical protein Q9222_003114 [Ikaeria aurantiellina]
MEGLERSYQTDTVRQSQAKDDTSETGSSNSSCPNGFNLDRKSFVEVAKDQRKTQSYSVVQHENYFALESTGGKKFGMLDMHTTHTLHHLREFPAIRLQAVIQSNVRCRDSLSARSVAAKRLIETSVNIYGIPGHAIGISNALHERGQFLQHPCAVDAGVDYQNPQYLTLPGKSVILNDMIQVPREERLVLDAINSEVNQIMDSLDQVDFDGDAAQSSHIMTPLQR